MKPRAVELHDAETAPDVMRRILRVRFAEACELGGALEGGRPEEFDQFRIACKRLRYAIERFAPFAPVLGAAEKHLSLLQDALGETHDCDLLTAELGDALPKTRERLAADRAACARRAATLWSDARILLHETLALV